MADLVAEALTRLGSAFAGQSRSFLPQLPELPSLGGSSGLPDINALLGQAGSNSGFPTIGGGSSGFPDIGGGGSGFPEWNAPAASYDRSEGALNAYAAGRGGPSQATDVSVAALGGFMAARNARRNAPNQTTQLPDEAALADAPVNVSRWLPLARKYADQYQVPLEDIMAIIENESGGNPEARSGENPGLGRAVGLMQLMQVYHGKDGADLTDPDTNVQRGVKYYASAYHRRGKDSRKAMAEFFGGGGAFDAAGNVREDIGDINIKMGPYLDTKFLPSKARWANRLTSSQRTLGVPPSSRQSVGALGLAARQIGKPYVFGGADENGFDCSGLVQWAYAQQGKQVGRTAQDQWNNTQRLQTKEVAPGDLVFFKNTYNAGTPITHVGIYAGNGQMLMAMAEGKPIQYVAMNEPYWQQHLAGYGRVQ